MARPPHSAASPERPLRSARDLIEEARSRIREIDCAAAKRAIDGGDRLLVIDVREEYEYEMARLGGSVHIARGSLEMVIEQDHPERGTPILVYCSRGDRSALAAATLQDMGYRDVTSLRGGLHSWRESGLPVVIPAQQRGPGSGI